MVSYKKIIEYVKSQVGYEEPNHDNHNKYSQMLDTLPWYLYKEGDRTWIHKIDGYDWCSGFVDAAFINTYGIDTARKLLNRPQYNNYGAVVKYAYNYLNKIGKTGKTPKLGATIYFQNSQGLSHTGIVIGYTETTVTTVEGNAGKGSYFVASNTYNRSSSYIFGYGYPLYDESEPQPTPEPTPKYEVGKVYEVVCNENLNVREKPTTVNSKIITSYPKGTQVTCKGTQTEKNGNIWMRVSEGWICCVYGTYTYVGAVTTPKKLNGYEVGKQYEVICKEPLNVRENASTKSVALTTISKGTIVTCEALTLDSEGNTWMRMGKGWIACIYRKEKYVGDVQSVDGYKVGNQYSVITRDGLNVRTTGSIIGIKITTLGYGTRFTCKAITHDKEGNTWMRIANPVSGWVACLYQGHKYVG